MTDNVIPLGTVTKLDLPADRVLTQAMGKMDGVVILGWENDGELYIASSIADGGEVNWLLDAAKRRLFEIAEHIDD